MDLFKDLVTEFYAKNLRAVLMASAVNPTICSMIVSLLAGDVYKPSMWHSLVGKSGFSEMPGNEFKEPLRACRSSHQVLPRSERPLSVELGGK